METRITSVDQYLQTFPQEVQVILEKIRSIIQEQAPDAEESFAYNMPAYKLYGKPLVYFAGFKHHIGFYVTPTGHSKFEEELSPYKQGKGSVQFPLNKPIPFNLIEKIVAFRVQENKVKAKK